MLYDIVLGGVLSATFIPVFVDRLSTRSEPDAWRAISAVVTLSAVVLVVATVALVVAAPLVIAGLTALAHPHTAQQSVTLHHEREVATSLLRWFAPQVALYGFIALMTALLNTRRRFVAPMWVPIANNLVCIAVLLAFAGLVPNPTVIGASVHYGWIVLLGLGTTAGVALQMFLLVPSTRALRLRQLRWRWEPGHEAVRTVLRLGGWTFGFVVANQAALYIVLALAVSVHDTAAPVSSYTYAYTFFQMPYAVVAVSVMSAVTPDLAKFWATHDLGGFRRRLSGGLRAVLAIMIPASVGLLLLARPAVDLLPTRLPGTAATTGSALAIMALGLPGFCAFLYVVRVLQAMQRTRVAFWLYLVENGVNIVVAIALVKPLGVRGLALSLSVGYSVGAVCGLVLLNRWLAPLAPPGAWRPLWRVSIASAVMAVVVLVVSNLSGADSGPALWARVLGSVVLGVVVFVGTVALLGRRDLRRRRRAPRPPAAPRPA
jgi:putative peptidoglycan lipid II flippase